MSTPTKPWTQYLASNTNGCSLPAYNLAPFHTFLTHSSTSASNSSGFSIACHLSVQERIAI